MTQLQIVANCFVRTADNNPNHDLRFEGTLKITHVYNGFSDEGFTQKHYGVDLKMPSSIRANYVGDCRGQGLAPIELVAPCLQEFGHNLASGEIYIIKGHVDEDHFNGLSWQINPLLACLRYPVICNYPVNRLIVYGCGQVKDVIELCDHKKAIIVQHKVVVNISYDNSPLGLNVKVVMHYSDAPPDLRGGFMPGVHILFRGYLTHCQTEDEMMRVEILTHDEVRRG
ncbi:hypothetical protein PTTG_29344 [Puccinia triticina 1-1 BBBD Race 1]|uniref:Uncharacterized protein n=1 Tax=Puccinia triticina (isolate 1-1 / race 1 (BBBD)) TaxID=630390 RepID=A0A180G4U2_PUCT1|nr:hypothetical protein PTTG_29344 [Puccinia triticina 1-1 BBBD Race 1]